MQEFGFDDAAFKQAYNEFGGVEGSEARIRRDPESSHRDAA
jgi:hypothetical protein